MVTVPWGHGISVPTSLSTLLKVFQLRLELLKSAAHVKLLTLAVRGGKMLKRSCRGKRNVLMEVFPLQHPEDHWIKHQLADTCVPQPQLKCSWTKNTFGYHDVCAPGQCQKGLFNVQQMHIYTVTSIHRR